MFDYDTMWAKFENLTGHKALAFDSMFNSIKDSGCVSVRSYTTNSQVNSEIRDWCEEQFGNNWIYSWNVYYFKYQRDATLFALRWA